jgi:hypothetical protein
MLLNLYIRVLIAAQKVIQQLREDYPASSVDGDDEDAGAGAGAR